MREVQGPPLIRVVNGQRIIRRPFPPFPDRTHRTLAEVAQSR